MCTLSQGRTPVFPKPPPAPRGGRGSIRAGADHCGATHEGYSSVTLPIAGVYRLRSPCLCFPPQCACPIVSQLPHALCAAYCVLRLWGMHMGCD